MEPSILRTIEMIFNLLCVCRRIRSAAPLALRQAMQARSLVYGKLEDLPRLSFWVSLCQSACLLDEGSPPRPTSLAADWLAISWLEQLSYLIDIWKSASPHQDICHVRRRLPERILAGLPLGPMERKQLVTLQALGICSGQFLNDAGRAILSGALTADPQPASPWRMHEQEIEIPYPPDWGQLWQLEQYLAPLAPGVYPLTDESVRLAAQWGSMEALQHILESGSGKELDPGLARKLSAQPQVRIHSGLVLEFTDPNELRRLRRNPSFRRALIHMLSPHHVFLDPDSARIAIRRLQKAGLLADAGPGEIALPRKGDTHKTISNQQFSSSERSYLLSLILLTERLDTYLVAPPGLTARISQALTAPLRVSASQAALKAFSRIKPEAKWLPEDEPPAAPSPTLIESIERAIQTQSSLDILYRKSQQSEPEYRHLTPIALEQRGLRYYLIAYCHSRRANRTFRLDRIEHLEYPPL